MRRRLAGTSVLTLLVVAGLLLGTSVALADSTATAGRGPWSTTGWPVESGGPPDEPAGIAYLGDGTYLVVDTNHNDEDGFNGWVMNPNNGAASNVDVEVDEDDATGVDYDPVSNTLFVSSDNGFIKVIRNFRTVAQTSFEIDTEARLSFDTEDPAYDRVTKTLYWVDGGAKSIFWVTAGPNGVLGDGDDVDGAVSISEAGLSASDWEALGWDPTSGNLLLAPRYGSVIYEVSITGGDIHHQGTITASVVSSQLGDMAGLGAGEAANTLWVTSRVSGKVMEIGYNGTTPTTSPTTTSTTPTTLPTTTSTTQATTTTTTTQPTTTTTQATTTTTQATTTTTQASTTTTTTQPTTTTTTQGPTTTTTQPSPPTTPPASPPPAGTFADTGGHTFAKAIGWAAARGITQGCTPNRFCPDDYVTRGQMAAFLVRAFEYSDDGGGGFFTDTVGDTFEKAIDRLRTAGITQGCSADRYCPGDHVTRGQMAAFLVRAFGFTDDGGGGFFDDTRGHTFEKAIDRLRAAGVTAGCNPPGNNNYCPDDLVTRGQMAAFLKRGFGQ